MVIGFYTLLHTLIVNGIRILNSGYVEVWHWCGQCSNGVSCGKDKRKDRHSDVSLSQDEQGTEGKVQGKSWRYEKRCGTEETCKTRKNIFSFFFLLIVFWSDSSNDGEFPIVFVFANTNSAHMYLCLCLLCRGKGHAYFVKTWWYGSRLGKRLSSKGTFLSSKNPFALTRKDTRAIPCEVTILYMYRLLIWLFSFKWENGFSRITDNPQNNSGCMEWDGVSGKFYKCCFHLYWTQPETNFAYVPNSLKIEKVLASAFASAIPSERCSVSIIIDTQFWWSLGKGWRLNTFNTGGYCPIHLSCLSQSSFLHFDSPSILLLITRSYQRNWFQR